MSISSIIRKVPIKYKPYIFLIFLVLTLLGFFFVKLKIFLVKQEKEYHEILYKLQQESFYQLGNDIKKISNILRLIKDRSNNINFIYNNLSLAYIKNIKITEIKLITPKFQIKSINNILTFTMGFYSIDIDKSVMSYLLSLSIPNYINYRISINDQTIITKGTKGSVSNIRSTTINPTHMATTELSINEKYLLKNKWNWIYNQIIENILIVGLVLFLTWLYFIYYVGDIINKFKDVKLLYLELVKERTLLFNYMKAKNYYNELIISSVKQKIRKISLEQLELLENILYYPLLIDYKENTLINNLDLSQEIRTLFGHKFHKKKINFCDSTINKEFIVDISKESFYQLIFSLIFNVINLLEVKSCLELQFTVEGKKLHEITLIYSGFQLSVEQMASYFNKQNCKEMFLLDMEQVITGLKLYRFSMKINFAQNNKNIMQFTYKKIVKDDGIKSDNKIINLKDYLNQ